MYMPHRPDLICSLKFVGEDDVLERLTADCASDGDAPPKVECACCTECYGRADGNPVIRSLPPPPPTVTKPDDTNVPTTSPTTSLTVAVGATSETPTGKGTGEPNGTDIGNENQEGEESLEEEGEESPEAEGPPPQTGRDGRDGRDSNDWSLLYREQIAQLHARQIANGIANGLVLGGL
jgi:hypothetical protein